MTYWDHSGFMPSNFMKEWSKHVFGDQSDPYHQDVETKESLGEEKYSWLKTSDEMKPQDRYSQYIKPQDPIDLSSKDELYQNYCRDNEYFQDVTNPDKVEYSCIDDSAIPDKRCYYRY